MSLKITPGKWECGNPPHGRAGYVYCDNALGSAVAICFGEELRFSIFTREQEIANAAMIAEAGTVANECQLMPRELLAQRDELLERLDTLALVVGLTAFKHETQRAALQEAQDAARVAIARVRGGK